MFLKELMTFLGSMVPIGELRTSIPLALKSGLSPFQAFFWSVLGNISIGFLLLLILDPLSRFLERHFYLLNRFFNWLFERTRRKHSQKIENWGALALVGFVAIPLPMTGVWTGALAAFVFGVPFKKAFPALIFGALIAGVVVTLVSLGAVSLKETLF